MKYKYGKFKIPVAAICLCFFLALSGCGFISDYLNNPDAAEETTVAVTEQKPTAPGNNTGRVLYGYDNLEDETMRIMYGMIGEYAHKRLSAPFKMDGELSFKQMYEAIDAYKLDNPEVFWLKSNCSYYVDSDSTYIYLEFTMESDVIEAAKKKFDSKVDEIISKAPSNASEFELEVYINDYIVDNCEYDFDAAGEPEVTGNSSDAYGCLVDGKAVCEGYARAFNVLCNRVGIESVNISGLGDNENHMWNCVKIGGEWYQTDVTWNDPDSGEEDVSRYLYFNLTDGQMYSTHTAGSLYKEVGDSEYSDIDINLNLFIPECNCTEYNYYMYNGVVLSDVDDADGIIKRLAESAKNGDGYFYIVVDDALDFDDVSDTVISGGYMAGWIDSANLRNFYHPSLSNEALVYKVSNLRVLIAELKYN